jgi:hypothetical protein
MFNPLRSIINFVKREFFFSEKRRDKNLKSLKSIIAFLILTGVIVSESRAVPQEYKQSKKKFDDLIPRLQQEAMSSIADVTERARRKMDYQSMIGV